jgi:chromosome partitioning protein
MTVISVANQKGGCGKTITSVNLAGALAAVGKKVLFIDLDPQAHATSSFGISVTDVLNSSYAIFESFLKNEPLDLHPLILQKYKNLWVIGSHISLSTMEQKMSGIKNATMVLNGTLKRDALKEFDYIIIDTPPNLGFLTFNALHASNHVIVPLEISLFSMKGVSYIKEILELSKSLGFEKPAVNFLITLFDGRSNYAKSFLNNAKERFGNDLLKTVIRANIKLREAAQLGRVIFEHDPSSNGAKDYASLAREIDPGITDEYISLKTHVLAAKTKEPKLIFRMHAPEAKTVYLAGSFNKWALDKRSLMKKLDNGTWVKIMALPAGDHRYKFVVDGKWIEDPGNNLTAENEFGGKDSIILVKNQ